MSVRIVKWFAVAAIAALVVLPVSTGDDGPSGPGGTQGNGACTPSGACLGGTTDGGGPTWTILYASGSHWQGSFTLNDPWFDASFGGAFPVTMLSPFTGTWVRTGPRTGDYTMIAYGLGPDAVTGVMVPYYIVKNSGSVEFTGRCDGLEILSVSIALYLPTQDPLGDDAPLLGCYPAESLMTAQPIPAEPPCEPASP